MRWYRRLYSLLVGLVVAGALLAASERPLSEWERNARLLERWKADPEHYARLQRDLQAFWNLPPERQAQLRRFDRILNKLEPQEKAHYWGILERYSLWFDRLSESDKQRIEAAADRKERVRLIRTLKEKQWIDRLPEKDRQELLNLEPGQKAGRINALRQEERKRRPQPQRPQRPAKDKDKGAKPVVPDDLLLGD